MTSRFEASPNSGQTKLYADYEAQPLALQRLVQIWHSLPEYERLGFLLALDEPIADRLLELTMPERSWP